MNVIYEISDPITGKKYIGSKTNWKGPGTYYGSSKNPEMKSIIKERKSTLVFNILEEVDSISNILEREEYWQRLYKVAESEMYWNARYAYAWDFYMTGKTHTQESIDKIKKSHNDPKMVKYLREKAKEKWDEKRGNGEDYFSQEGMDNLRKEGAKVGKFPRSEEWSRKHRERKLGSSNTPESKTKTSKALKLKYLNGEIENAYAKKVIATSETDGTEMEHKSITQGAISIGYKAHNLRQSIKTGEPLGGFYWKLKQTT
jgi:hypothetical protein